MKLEYILITIDEKGFSRIGRKSREEIEKLIGDEVENNEGELPDSFFDLNGREALQTEYVGGDGTKFIIIKGEVVLPEPVSRVTEYKIS